jgi:hypothetical protein
MNKIIMLLLLVTLAGISCKNAAKEIDTLEIAKQYYKTLDNADDSEIATLLTDSILIKETEYDYEQTFSLKEYVEWCKWDSVFEPTYQILQIKQEGDIVKAKISKIDKRILFLHEEPIITNEVIRFDHDKISSVEKIKYIVFNDTTFVKNREALLGWMDENYPDLNTFIHDQTEAGGLKYLKAIALYKNRK